MSPEIFEGILKEVCSRLTEECKSSPSFSSSKEFENRVREVISTLLVEHAVEVDFSPHPYGFPDIVLGEYGIEVKFTTNDTWRSVANSVFEGFRNASVQFIYLVFCKLGGVPSVRWGRYEECVMHVRTSHVPRFEVDLDAAQSLFEKFGVSYDQFSSLSEEDRMVYVRDYARGRLKPGERLWWLENAPDDGHSLPLEVKLFANLSASEKLKLRGEASLLCPQIVGSSRNRTKYSDPIMYLLTYHGVLTTRDAFSAGSAAGPERGGIYVQRALQNVEDQMVAALEYLDSALFLEYWGEDFEPGNARIRQWLHMADHYAALANPSWKPSEFLFLTPS